MKHPLIWGIVIGVIGTWAAHAIVPSSRAIGQP